MKIQYKDYSCWVNKRLKGSSLKKLEEFWLNEFRGELPVLELPAKEIQVRRGNMVTDKLDFIVGEEITRRIVAFCNKYNLTLFMAKLAFVFVLMYKYTNQTDIIFTSFISGRVHEDLEELIGYFINLLGFRIKMGLGDRFVDLVQHVKEVSLKGFEHQIYPFEKLIEKLKVKRDQGRSLFSKIRIDVGEPVEKNTEQSEDTSLKSIKDDLEFQHLYDEDLYINFIQVGNRITCSIQYYRDMFDRSWIELLRDRYLFLVENILDNENNKISDIEFHSSHEKDMLDELDVNFNI
jgi:non-ribosomal peptide synthetase component F